ncbi:MAG: hypothetical protein AB7O56_11190 [Bauldia sp.]
MARANGMTERAREALHDAEEMGERVIRRGAASARRASRAVHHAADEVLETADTTRHNLEETIASRPLTSVLVAAGIGFLVAKIWR